VKRVTAPHQGCQQVQTVAVVEPSPGPGAPGAKPPEGDAHIRIGDQERRAAIDALSRHTSEGRLSLEEFEELAGRVYAARTRGDLDDVLSGLPDRDGGGDSVTTVADPPPPAGAATTGSRRRFVAIMSSTKARGRWRAPARITAFAFWGHVKLDLRQADFDEPVVDVTAWAIMGGVDVVVPDGMRVELDGMVLMGGSADRTQRSTTGPAAGATVVRLHTRGLWGGVTARNSRKPHARSADRTRELLGGYLDDHIEDLRESARQAMRTLQASVPPPPAPKRPPMPFAPPHARHRGRARRSEQGGRSTPPFPGPGGRPIDLSDFLPRFLTEERVPAPQARANGQAATGPVSDGSRLPQGTLTILVTDMVGSTALAEELGDKRWWDILQAHNDLVRAEVERHGGIEVKAQGDGFLVVFASAREGILAAVDIQRAVARYRSEDASRPIELRIGLHTGDTVESDGDVFGQNVILAVRIADAAAPGDVLVSGLTRDLTAAAGDLRFSAGEEISLKGFSVPWRVHRVAWA
jgi:class 3 adenylate cyclase